MLIDARRISSEEVISCDVCIVGAGAAGIAIANELDGRDLSVLLLESGGEKLEAQTQDLYDGKILDPNHGALIEQRQRRLGGTTNVWGGRCAPFDPIDFEARPYVPYSGWPITRRDLDPYYRQAHEYCDLGTYTYQVAELLSEPIQDFFPGLHLDSFKTDESWLFSPPTNFRVKYYQKLKQSKNVKLFLYANCLTIQLNDSHSGVEYLNVSSLERNDFKVYAKKFVLAMGCLEVTRVLLLSNRYLGQKIGQDSDMLGRFYMGHISGELGELRLDDPRSQVVWDYERTKEGVFARRNLRISEEAQRQHELLNVRFILSYPNIANPEHQNAILSAMYLAKLALLKRQSSRIYYSKSFKFEGVEKTLNAHLENILKGSPQVLLFLKKWLGNQLFSQRKLPSVVIGNKSNCYTLHFDAEQSPNPNSRIFLDESLDAFNLNRLKVDWKYTDFDIQNVIRSYELLKDEIEKSGLGSLSINPNKMEEDIKTNLGVASHHLGTTRMGNSPRHGVVDSDCRVYGVNNLYIASGSVFPSSSFANPTLTVLSLSLRLSEQVILQFKTS